jgi:hypothetical protein
VLVFCGDIPQNSIERKHLHNERFNTGQGRQKYQKPKQKLALKVIPSCKILRAPAYLVKGLEKIK